MQGDVRGVPRLVGRDRQLAELAAVAGALAAGAGAVVLIEGAAGTGKSSLLGELRTLAAARGCQVRHVAAIELDRDQPFAVIERILAIGPESAGMETTVPLIDGGLMRLRSTLLSLRRPDARPPLLLTLDDLHWADAQSLRAIELLLADGAPPGVTVALAWRMAELPHDTARRLRQIDAAKRLSLRDLPAADSAELLAQILPAAEPAFLAACHQVTDGNPLLLRELAQAVCASGLPADAANAERIIDLTPDSIRTSVLARLGQLSDDAVSLASAVAILGDNSPLHHAAHVADLDAGAAAIAADRLLAVDILTGDAVLRFRHPVLAASVLADLGPFTRARLYRRAADVVAADGLMEQAGALLLRCPPGGNPESVAHLRAAATSAMRGGDAGTAVRLLRRALAEPARREQQPGLLVDLARVEIAAGEPEAVDHLDEALRSFDDPSERARTLRALARLYHARYDFPRAVRLTERGLTELADDDPYRDRLTAPWLMAASLDPERRAQTAPVYLRLAAAARAGSLPRDPELKAALSMFVMTIGGEPAVIAELAEGAIDGDAISNDDGLGLVPDYALHALLATGRLGAVVRCAGVATETAEHHASMLGAASAACWRAHARLAQGKLAAAIADAELALAPRRLGWPAHSTYGAGALALARLELGELDGAREAIGLIAQIATPDPPGSYFAGVVELAAGDAGGARALFEHAGNDLALFGVDQPAMVPWRSGAALAALAQQDVSGARQLAAAELALAQRTNVPAVIGRSLRIHGLTLGGTVGIEALREACALLENSEHTLEHVRAEVDLGSALRREGDRRASRDVLHAANLRAASLGCLALAERAASEHAASGGRLRRTPAVGPATLTPSELRIAQLAAKGFSNPQIAAELFLTRKTVEWHLSRVFRKLDITSRDALAGALGLDP